MERIGGDVQRELARFGPAAGMGRIVEVWPACVGESVARNAWPSRIARDGTLHVSASSSAWAFELGQLAPTVLAQLKEALGDDAPPQLKFAWGRLPEPDLPIAEQHPEPPPAPGPEQLAAAAEAAAVIEDEQLRALVARAAAASLAQAASGRPVW